MYLIPTYSAQNAISITEIFRANMLEYPRILLIFLTVFRSIEVGIFDFSPSGINRLNTELVSKFCFNVWGCLSLNGVGDLHRVKAILTGPEYRKILIHHFVPSANRLNSEGFIFQQDNDPKHTSNVAKKYLQNKKID